MCIWIVRSVTNLGCQEVPGNWQGALLGGIVSGDFLKIQPDLLTGNSYWK